MAINNYKHNLEEPLVVKDLQITGTRVDNQNTLVFTKSIQLSADNTSGGGLILSDDGDFVDLNTGFGAFRFTSGISVYSASRGGSPVIQLESGGNIYFANNSGTTTRGVIGLCGDSDFWFFGGGATASNAGFAQISTGDDGTEPIYVRQYVGDPRAGTLQRTLTLLNESGNTIIPGSTRIGGATSRSSSGLTVGFSNNSTYVPNTDVGDGYRMLSLVNESTTTNAMSVLGFRINPDSGTANAMLDLRFVQTGATSTSALHYTFNHGGSFVDRFTILSSGSVGIGTTTPVSSLEVSQDTTGLNDLTITNLNTGNNITKASRIRFRLTDSVGTKKDVAYITAYTYNLDSSAGNHLSFFTRTADATPTEKLRLDNNGNLVLGSSFTPTGTSSQPLQVNGGAYINGNIGIGTTNPFGSNLFNGLDVNRASAQIHARNIGTTTDAGVYASDQDYFSTPSYSATIIRKLGTGFAGNIFSSIPHANLGVLAFQNAANGLIYTNGAAPLIFATLSTEAMRIDSSQRLGLGTNSPTSKLHVVGDSLVTGIATVGLGATSTPPSNSQMSFELTSDTNLRIKVRGTDGVLRSANITLT